MSRLKKCFSYPPLLGQYVSVGFKDQRGTTQVILLRTEIDSKAIYCLFLEHCLATFKQTAFAKKSVKVCLTWYPDALKAVDSYDMVSFHCCDVIGSMSPVMFLKVWSVCSRII